MPIVSFGFDISKLKAGKADAVEVLNVVSDTAGKTQKSLDGVGKSAQSNAGKLRLLTKEIVGLAAAYKSLQALSGYLGRIFNFSSNIEDSKIAIASVISATNKITNAQGKSLEGIEKFNAAQEISADLMEHIQAEALKTTATFDSLVDGVSGIIAPATKAGIAVEKLPKFAVTAAQAMTAMKVPVQQMRTEIEALLSGNINKAQDILATNLGITGEMVRNWQKQGTLVDELTKRLETFQFAGEATANTWSGLVSNVEDAFDYLSSKTGHGVFEAAKQSYREFIDLLVSTKGSKVGVSEDIENLVDMVTELQDAIGDRLIAATREFIEEIRELNKPENVAALKKELEDIGQTMSDVWGLVKKVGGEIASVVKVSLDGWNQMPELIKEIGIIGALVFGWKGRALLAGLGYIYSDLRQIVGYLQGVTIPEFINDIASGNVGKVKLPNGGLARAHGDAYTPPPVPSPGLSRSHGTGTSSPRRYKAESAIGGFDGGKGKKGKGAGQVENARESIQKLREEIASLNGESTKAGNSLEQKLRSIEKTGKAAKLSAGEIAQLKQEYREAFQTNTLKDFDKAVLKLENNAAALRQIEMAETLREWEGRFSAAGLSAGEAAPKLARLKEALENQSQVKDLKAAADFYKEYAELSGQTGQSIELQNQLLEKQRQEWINIGIPIEDVNNRIRLMREEIARDPLSGLSRGLKKYSSEATDFASQMETAVTNAFTGMEDAFVQFVQTGKLSFSDLANSIISDLLRIAIRASITGPLAQGIGNLFSRFFGGGMSFNSSPGYGSGGYFLNGTSSLPGFGSGYGIGSAKGNVFSGGSLHDYVNTVVSQPTFFGYGSRLTAFARGAGVMGEAGPEAIMPLMRTSSGHLGVRAVSDNGPQSGSNVQINIINATGEKVTQQTRTDNYGNKTIDVMVGDAAAKQAVKPGSAMNRAIRGVTGVQQQVIRR